MLRKSNPLRPSVSFFCNKFYTVKMNSSVVVFLWMFFDKELWVLLWVVISRVRWPFQQFQVSGIVGFLGYHFFNHNKSSAIAMVSHFSFHWIKRRMWKYASINFYKFVHSNVSIRSRPGHSVQQPQNAVICVKMFLYLYTSILVGKMWIYTGK